MLFGRQPSESDAWSDDEITNLVRTMPKLRESTGFFDPCYVTRICDDTIVKLRHCHSVPSSEAMAMEFVFSNTSILTPRLRRAFQHQDVVYIVMEYVEGEELAGKWTSLSLWQQFRIAWTLRRYIRQLRKIHLNYSPPPGPIGDSPQECEGSQFGLRSKGPFKDYATMATFFNRLLNIAKRYTRPYWMPNPAAPPDAEPFDDSQPLVFSHHDLSMRNIILGADGRVWLIDWGWSGFYPPWFEYLATVGAALNDKAPASWRRMIPLITGAWYKHEDWWKQIAIPLNMNVPADEPVRADKPGARNGVRFPSEYIP
jgi:hypothetical protein